ncbi:626_t:CDS:2 [Entrophospora sp. SA101]|nr:626_t:CDS:2 [Entrophospora sp. SA101]
MTNATITTNNNSSNNETKVNSGSRYTFSKNSIIFDGTFFPPLEKVLINKSGTPLSQYNFHSYLRQEWQGQENLNFWLDVVTHENLFESWRSTSSAEEDTVALSSIDSKNPVISSSSKFNSTTYGIKGSGRSNDEKNEGERSHNVISVIEDNDYGDNSSSSNSDNFYDKPRKNGHKLEIIKRINEEDLAKSALSIYEKYGHMNILPEESRTTMQDLIERQGRYNPVVFSSAKSYVYHIMNVIYFPKFIQSAIDINISQLHAIIALPLGIIALTSGFAFELYSIFVGIDNRLARLWAFPAILIGWILLQTAATRFSPLLVLFNTSEQSFLLFQRIKEKPVISAHKKRALTFIMWDALAAVLTLGILFAIPPIALYDT